MATKINMAAIRKKIAQSPKMLDVTERVAKKITLDNTAIAEYEFSSSAITKEVEQGPSGANLSGLLGGYGNLFTFIGFKVEATPTEIVKQMWKSVRFKNLSNITYKGKRAIYSYKVSIPSPEDFKSSTPLPWAAQRSWLESISTGLSNFGNYLSKLGKGRSTGGIQKKEKIRGGNMKTDPYFKAIYNRFSRIFKPYLKF